MRKGERGGMDGGVMGSYGGCIYCKQELINTSILKYLVGTGES